MAYFITADISKFGDGRFRISEEVRLDEHAFVLLDQKQLTEIDQRP